jgi:hypothetical protein
MSKDDERSILGLVYGSLSEWQLAGSEAPDFLLIKGGDTALGIEITEYFDNDGEARLHRISGYGRELIEGRRFRHKDDKLNFRVEQVTYLPGGDRSKGRKITAIIHEPTHIAHRLNRLLKIIDNKSAKVSTYLERAPAVDLVINDPCFAFRFKEYEKLYRSIRSDELRKSILQNNFREIFLVTRSGEAEIVCIPLKANFFAEEIVLHEHFYRMLANESPIVTRDFFGSLVCTLSAIGFGDAKLQIEDSDVHLRYSSIDFVYRDGAKTIEDYTAAPEANRVGTLFTDLVKDIRQDYRNKADTICATKTDFGSCLGIYFSANCRKVDCSSGI